MSNSYFQFKRFTIYQANAAMKVCTDACLFGSWVAEIIQNKKRVVRNAIDIGTGTGLLALMLAQKLDCNIDAVEIDEGTVLQAKDNVAQSDYNQMVHLKHGDIRRMEINTRYDLVISNPPFYKNDLKSISDKRNFALHSTVLTLEELLSSVVKLLSDTGVFAVLLPFSRSQECIQLAENQKLFLQEQMLVRQTENHTYFRSMLLFSTTRTEVKTSEITIKKEGSYTGEFAALLKDYYLYL